MGIARSDMNHAKIFLVLVLFSVGCRGGQKVKALKPIPLSVRVTADESFKALPDLEQSEAGEAFKTLYDPKALSEFVAQSLRESQVFSKVMTGDESGADIVLSLRPRGTVQEDGPQKGQLDLMPGKNQFGACCLTTGTWLFAGFASWWISDRKYGSGDQSPELSYSIQLQASGNQKDLRTNPVSLKNLSLRFIDRSNWKTKWWMNILIPSYWISPDPELESDALAGRSLEIIGEDLTTILKNNFMTWNALDGEIILAPITPGAIDRLPAGQKQLDLEFILASKEQVNFLTIKIGSGEEKTEKSVSLKRPDLEKQLTRGEDRAKEIELLCANLEGLGGLPESYKYEYLYHIKKRVNLPVASGEQVIQIEAAYEKTTDLKGTWTLSMQPEIKMDDSVTEAASLTAR